MVLLMRVPRSIPLICGQLLFDECLVEGPSGELEVADAPQCDAL
jgi:hypothetical protein